ncbi:hypothetical protein [Ponticaulis sp.]|uniref:DUF7408 domain-containing protein n=1 Tax=Ponticaulis sp. TaxID=2020902 RepID=UPI00262904C5|nr:hypothetical protein [Ponticaulis sp.]MDF1679197.1 hypothetical protein [Ponticaulis sp.]
MTAAHLSFDPHLGWPVLIALGIVALIVWGLYLVRRGRAWLTRALALTLIAAAISNPLWVRENREALPSTVAIVVDQSSSMGVADRRAIANEVSAALQSQLAALENVNVQLVETRPGAPETQLAAAMTSALADTPRDQIAGTILITDGQAHDIPEATEDLEEFGPVHGLIIGSEDETDRRVEIVSAPSYGIVGDEAVMQILVTASDTITTTVDVSVNGEPARRILVETGQPTEVPVTIDRRGPNTVTVEIAEAENELTAANNITAMTLTGIRDSLRVLLITGEPHRGGRAWRDLLKSDPMVDLVHFTILRPPHKQDATPTDELALIPFPTNELFEDKLREFDLIIFDRYRRRGVLHLRYLDNIARYVDQGGALIISAGEPFAGPASLHRTPLASVLPLSPTGVVETQRFVPQISGLGERHSITSTLEQDALGPWYRYIGAREVTGDVLMTTEDGQPLLAVDRVGEGRVAELMSDQLWLWARGHEGGGPFAELVRRIVHWTMREPELEEERLTMRSEGEDIIANLTSLSSTPDSLNIIFPDGSESTYGWAENEYGVQEVRLPSEQLGLYRAAVGDLETIFLNGPAQPREFADLLSTTERILPLAEATNGVVTRLTDAGDTPELRMTSRGGGDGNWIGVRDRQAYAVRDASSQPILPTWLVAGMLFGLLLLAWRREGR